MTKLKPPSIAPASGSRRAPPKSANVQPELLRSHTPECEIRISRSGQRQAQHSVNGTQYEQK
eukprot:2986546-Pleurochrysis_carterae.AAC.3